VNQPALFDPAEGREDFWGGGEAKQMSGVLNERAALINEVLNDKVYSGSTLHIPHFNLLSGRDDRGALKMVINEHQKKTFEAAGVDTSDMVLDGPVLDSPPDEEQFFSESEAEYAFRKTAEARA
jgi:hypothetical protein